MGKQKHSKNDSSSELEGLRAEDGGKSIQKGIKIVVYNRRIEAHMDMAPRRISPRQEGQMLFQPEHKMPDKKTEKPAEVTTKEKEHPIPKRIVKKGGKK